MYSSLTLPMYPRPWRKWGPGPPAACVRRVICMRLLCVFLCHCVCVPTSGIEAAWAGGLDGRVVIDKFLPLVKVCAAVMCFCSSCTSACGWVCTAYVSHVCVPPDAPGFAVALGYVLPGPCGGQPARGRRRSPCRHWSAVPGPLLFSCTLTRAHTYTRTHSHS